jgi:hypothetical protein
VSNQPPSGPSDGYPPPPPAGPWASDDLPAYQGTAPAPVAERPPSITTAVKLMWAGAGLTVLGILTTFLQTDAIRDRIEDNDSSLSKSDVDAAMRGTIVLIVVIGAISVGLWLWMASANGKGLSWARVVATVLGVLNVVFTLLGAAMGNQTPVALLFNLISVVLAVTILVLLYRPDSNAWYAAHSR